MNEALNTAYSYNYPVITYLVNWNLYSIDNRNGNIQKFRDKQSFLSYCKRNLKAVTVSLIIAGNEITLIQNTIN